MAPTLLIFLVALGACIAASALLVLMALSRARTIEHNRADARRRHLERDLAAAEQRRHSEIRVTGGRRVSAGERYGP